MSRPSDERLFERVGELDPAADQTGSPRERIERASLLLRAAQKAATSSAHEMALGYLTRAIALLPDGAWQSDRAAVLSLYREAMESAYAVGDDERAQRLFDTALEHAETLDEKACLRSVPVAAATARMSFPEALARAHDGLALYGIQLAAIGQPQADAELASVRANLNGRAVEALLDLPRMEAREPLACMDLLSRIVVPAFASTQPGLLAFIVARMVNLSLTHGNTDASALAYTWYGLLSCRAGDYGRAQEFGRLGVELGRRLGDALYCQATNTYAGIIAIWRSPLRSLVPVLQNSITKGIAAGESLFASFGTAVVVQILFHQGVELARVLVEIDEATALTRGIGNQSGVAWMRLYRRMIGRLQSHDETPEETVLEVIPMAAGDRFIRGLQEILELQLCYLFRDLDRAREMSDLAVEQLASFVGSLRTVEHNFYTSLTLAAACDGVDSDQRDELLSRIAENQQHLGAWAKECPENFRHKYLMVAGEVARVEGRSADATGLYEQAIELAAAEGFLQDEALANELAGRFYRATDRKRVATTFLSAALMAYSRWGALAKARSLEEEFRELKAVHSPAWRAPEANGAARGENRIDLAGILSAAEAIAGETILERLLEKLLSVCLAQTGATRGVLILEENHHLVVRAVGTAGTTVSLVRVPLEDAPDVPRTIVERVYRTGELLVVADAHQSRFATDPYIERSGARSIFCCPLRRPSGLLHLESDRAPNVFTPEGVSLLRLLSAQIGVALERSLLLEQTSRSRA